MASGPWGCFSVPLFIFGQKYSVNKYEHALINFLAGSAKLAMWLTHKNKAQGAGYIKSVLVLKGLVRAKGTR